MAVKLIVTDLDGTFYHRDMSYDKEKFDRLLDQLHASGIRFAVASGNQYYQLISFFDHPEEMAFVAENGALIINEGKELSYATITSATSSKDTSYKSGEQYIVGKFDIVLKAFSASWETIITNKTVSALPYSSDEGGYVGTIQINGLKPNMRTRITGYVESRSNTLNGTGQISINNEIGVGADEFISFSQDLFDSVGEPVAFLEFKIKAPSQENVLEYSNYTSNLQGFFYTLSITKLEQFL